MQANSLQIYGIGNQSQAPVSPNDLIRLQELQSAMSGVAPLHHRHVSADITDLPAAVLGILTGSGLPLSGVINILLTPGAGLIRDSLGLRVDSGVVSLRGHTHLSTDITDFSTAVYTQMLGILTNSPTLVWSGTGGQVSAAVRIKASGGLISDASGVSVDLGPGHTQAAFGDHTHAQLHNALTLGTSSTLSLSLTGQQLSGEILMAALSGLLATPSGVALDFGTGHNQAMRGDALASISLSGVASTLNTATLLLGIAGSVLSGVVPLDSSPPGGYGQIVAGSNGLRIVLGTTGNTAAAGNHIHAVATTSSDGFMSAQDKGTLLDLSTATGLLPSSILFTRETVALSGTRLTGQYRWDQDMLAIDAQLICQAPQVLTLLGLELNGVLTGDRLTIPSGTAWTDMPASGTLNRVIPAGQMARWRVLNGSVDGITAATSIGLVMRVKSNGG